MNKKPAVPCYEVLEDCSVSSDFPVFHVPGFNLVAEACTVSRCARYWNIVDRNTGAFICQLRGVKERDAWICRAARAANIPFNAMYQ